MKIKESIDRPIILSVGGWGKLIANMSVLIYNKSLIIIDAGKGMEVPKNWNYITPKNLSTNNPTFPNFKILDPYLKKGYKIDAMFLTHCHGDHLAGLQDFWKYLEKNTIQKDSFPVYTSKFTSEFSKKIITGWTKVQWIELKNEEEIMIKDYVTIKPFFLPHSSLHSVGLYMVFHPHSNTLLYLPDHKVQYSVYPNFNDQYPDQKKVDYLINEFLKKGIDMIVMESTTINPAKALGIIPCEASVCQNLKNLICRINEQSDTIIVSTYSTNPTRLKAIIDAAAHCNRKVGIFGRGMWNGYSAAQKCDLFNKETLKNVVKIEDITQINKSKNNFVLLVTGHMGEANAGLSKILRGEIPYNWSKKDVVIVSSETIPKEGPRLCRSFLRSNLMTKRINFYIGDDHKNLIHTSGHINYDDYVKYFKKWKVVKKVLLNHGDYQTSLNIYPLLHNENLSTDNLYLLKDGDSMEI